MSGVNNLNSMEFPRNNKYIIPPLEESNTHSTSQLVEDRLKRARSSGELSLNPKQPKITSFSTPTGQHILQSQKKTAVHPPSQNEDSTSLSNAVRATSTPHLKTSNSLGSTSEKDETPLSKKQWLKKVLLAKQPCTTNKTTTETTTQKELEALNSSFSESEDRNSSFSESEAMYNADLSQASDLIALVKTAKTLEEKIIIVLTNEGPKKSKEILPLMLHPDGKQYSRSTFYEKLGLLHFKGIIDKIPDGPRRSHQYCIHNQNEENDEFSTKNTIKISLNKFKNNNNLSILEKNVIQVLTGQEAKTFRELESALEQKGNSNSDAGIHRALRMLQARGIIVNKSLGLDGVWLYSIPEPKKEETIATQTTTTTTATSRSEAMNSALNPVEILDDSVEEITNNSTQTTTTGFNSLSEEIESPQQILQILSRGEAKTVKELANELQKNPVNIHRWVNQLLDEGKLNKTIRNIIQKPWEYSMAAPSKASDHQVTSTQLTQTTTTTDFNSFSKKIEPAVFTLSEKINDSVLKNLWLKDSEKWLTK